MKSNKTKGLLIIILLCSLLSLVSSCRKNTDGGESSSIAESLITSERSSLQPVVVVPSPSSSRKTQEENEVQAQKVTPSGAENAGTEAGEGSEKSETESSVALVIDPSLSESSSSVAEISSPRVPAAPVFRSVTSEIVEVEDVIEPVYETLFSYRGIEARLTAYTDKAEITIPAGTTEEDISAAAALLLKAYPELGVVTYSVSDGVVSLEYPGEKEEDVIWFAGVLENEAKWYIDRVFESLSAPQVEEGETEEDNGHTFIITEEIPIEEEKTEETVPEEAPVTEKGRFIKGYSLSVSDKLYLAASHNNFYDMISADFLLSFNDRFSAGVKVGYDFGKYLSLEADVKYNFTDNIYLIGGAGYRFGFGEAKEHSSALISLGVGYELALSDSLDFFIEGSLMFLPTGYSRFNPAVTFGVRYDF